MINSLRARSFSERALESVKSLYSYRDQIYTEDARCRSKGSGQKSVTLRKTFQI